MPRRRKRWHNKRCICAPILFRYWFPETFRGESDRRHERLQGMYLSYWPPVPRPSCDSPRPCAGSGKWGVTEPKSLGTTPARSDTRQDFHIVRDADDAGNVRSHLGRRFYGLDGFLAACQIDDTIL